MSICGKASDNSTMNKSLNLLLLAGLVGFFSAACRGESETAVLECLKSASFLAPAEAPDNRKYAPDREVDLLHLALDVTPDFLQRKVEGKATLRFKPIVKPAWEVKLDGADLAVLSVTATEKILGYQATAEKVIITFAEAIPVGREASVTISYSAEPKMGLYFRTPEMGYKEGDTHLFSQGEQTEARNWYPCFDSPNEMATSEITCRLPAGMTSISNGRLVSEEKDAATGLTVFHWLQEKPHANYLVSLVAGYFKKIEDKYKEVPLAFYTPPSEIKEAINSFRDTKDMMGFFEEEIGVAYPWPKYDQTCVNDFVAGGMENTSCTTLTDFTLFAEASENIQSSEGLVAHELAHQWFGDLVTCKDWSHTWLNESFATYYETLYNGHKNGRDAMLYELYGRARQITGNSNDEKAIVRRTYDSSSEMFSFLSYPKGGWVLHILRSELGEELYRKCIKTYLERHRHGNVVTDDLRAVVEELSGNSHDQFFEQWLYHGGHPELEVNYNWDERTRLARVAIKQVHNISESVLLFNLPLTIRFKGKSGAVDRLIQVTQKEEAFYFPFDEAPQLVRVDPEYTLLAKITFKLPNAMLSEQLAEKKDAIGRLIAVEQLADKKDKEAVAKLKGLLNDDGFYGVRIEAARALRSIHSDEALEALLASTKQPDARVRRTVQSDIAGFYNETAYKAALETLQAEKNPEIVSTALESLSAYAKPEVRETLLRFLHTESFRNELADAAIGAMRAQDDPAYIPPLMEALKLPTMAYPNRGLTQGLGAIAYLARNEEKKDAVREFLVSHVNAKRRRVQLAAISALGRLGDPQAIPVLEKFTTAAKESPERTAAEKAVADLRAARKPVDEFVNLRREILDWQKENRALKKEFEALKKEIEAKQPTPSAKPNLGDKPKKKPPLASPRNQ